MPQPRQLLSNTKLHFVLIVCSLAIASAIGWAILERTADSLVKTTAEQTAEAWAAYVGGQLPRIEAIADGEPISFEDRHFLETMRQFGNVFRFKLFTKQGHLIVVSDDLHDRISHSGDLREHNPTALNVITNGRPFSQLEDGSAEPGKPNQYIETYTPVIRNGKMVAVVEVYIDQTAEAAQIRQEFLLFGLEIAGLLLAALCPPLLALVQATRTLRARNAEIAIERDRAQASERSKAEFVANMSHEIRTPLNGVLGMTTLILDTNLDEEQQQYAETIQNSGEALLSVLNDILDFSKIEAGKLELEDVDFGVVPLIDGTVELFAQQAHMKGLEMPTYVGPGVPETLHGDEGRLRQILLNLISNAIKFTDEGGVAIEVSLALGKHPDGSTVVRFEVADSGIGIPEDKLETVFEQFRQVDGTSTRKYGGTGLGLAIAKRLVELMGGYIGVERREEGGCLFWFTIPFACVEKEVTWPHNIVGRIEGQNILVVDDNPVNRLVFERQLNALGARVSLATGAQSAIRKAHSSIEAGAPFDIVITDHMMPGTDGLDLGPVLRAMPGLAATRYVLSSSSGMFNSHNSARKHGFDAALPKPLRPGALIRCIEGLSSQPAAAASPVAVPSTASPVATIPTSAKPPAVETSPVVPLSPASASTPRTSQIRILLAEDNATNQKLTIALLKRENYAIDVAGNGLEALKALHNLPYDLVLMDVQMPELDGMETSRKIRDSNASYASVPIIGITAHAMKGDRERVLESGMNDYLTKPIDKTELLEKVARWTANKAQGKDAPSTVQSKSA